MDTTIQNTHSSYAGFGKRLLAYLIDVIIISVLWFILASILGALGFGGLSAMGGMENLEEPSGAALGLLAGGMMGMMFVGYLVQWLYFASMHSSARQATFGKSAMNLIVTDMDGGRISFGKASLRYLRKNYFRYDYADRFYNGSIY